LVKGGLVLKKYRSIEKSTESTLFDLLKSAPLHDEDVWVLEEIYNNITGDNKPIKT
jgi:hypothetical protein